MKLMKWVTAFAATGTFVVPVLAGEFDGSLPLICATVEARDCVSGAECFGGTPDEVGAPAFVRIDFEGKMIAGPRRTTPILLMEQGDHQLLLQGTEIGYAWAFALDQTSGRFSASLTNLEGAFLLFGSCTAL